LGAVHSSVREVFAGYLVTVECVLGVSECIRSFGTESRADVSANGARNFIGGNFIGGKETA
jgi:hypothetical protein